MEFVLRPWRRMFDYKGRATRREYWTLIVIWYALMMAIAMAGGAAAPGDPYDSPPSPLFMIPYFLVFGLGFLASISAGVRRLHDHDKTGWFLLVSLFPLFGWIFQLIMMLTPGTEGENEYGPDPRDPNAERNEVAEVFA